MKKSPLSHPKPYIQHTSVVGGILGVLQTYPYYYYFMEVASSVYIPLIVSALTLHILLLYIAASRSIESHIGELLKGSIIGVNTSFNAYLLLLLTGIPYLSFFVFLYLFLSSSLTISRNPTYRIGLAWLNWFLPMSWLVSVPGILFFLINILVSPLSRWISFCKTQIQFHRRGSTFIMEGGLIHPLRGFAGFNMANFVFINPRQQLVVEHEVGHTLSVAAFGWLFHYIGAIDENYIQDRPHEAFAEYIADSHSRPTHSVLSLWGRKK